MSKLIKKMLPFLLLSAAVGVCFTALPCKTCKKHNKTQQKATNHKSAPSHQ